MEKLKFGKFNILLKINTCFIIDCSKKIIKNKTVEHRKINRAEIYKLRLFHSFKISKFKTFINGLIMVS